MLDYLPCNVSTADELDTEIRKIFLLENVNPGMLEIRGTYHVHYSDESVKQATLIRELEFRGVIIAWHRD